MAASGHLSIRSISRMSKISLNLLLQMYNFFVSKLLCVILGKLPTNAFLVYFPFSSFLGPAA